MIIGGVARSLINFRGPLLKTLIMRGHEIIACASETTPEIRQKLASVPIRYYQLPTNRTSISPLHDLRTLLILRKIIQTESPDCILSYTAKAVIYSHIAARGCNSTEVYGMITGLGYPFGNRSVKQKIIGILIRHLYRIALINSSGVFFQNQDDKNTFKTQGLLPKHVLVTVINGSGVDLNRYPPEPLPEEPVFLLVARLLIEKGIREYYQAAVRIKKKHPHAKFLLAGALDSNPGSISQEELKKWQDKKIISYLGWIDDIRQAFSKCRIYVLPSYREGTPRSILEAMAMGRPIITTDTPGCRETVQANKNGFLVPVRNVEKLEKAMEQFILHPELAEQMGKFSLRIANQKYDVHKVNRVIMETMKV